ncbi:hypothetical protein LTR37_020531 [Vermiconidia calcicola]|uniref:Uncharacterized protein n=1 Tax=Vermiconidia calcicola TaxID=1690605 RepID=A0ACC3MAZ8_9PEZI|nr:hypothetical protein LTR37_020531 [Vermiconidia calcicola]
MSSKEKYDGGHKPSYEDRRNSTAEDELAALGYTQELTRTRSTLNVAFMSFVLASVPYGLSTTLYYPLVGGGATTVIWGWCLVSALMLCVAASLGEITSAYPLAGGVYYQSYMVSPPSYRKIMSWINGWSFTLGNVIITLSVNFGTTLLLLGCINIFKDAEGNGIFLSAPYQTWLIFLAITLITNMISSLGNRWLAMLDTITVVFTFLGVFAIIICGHAIAAEGRRNAAWVFGGFEVSSGWSPPGWAFCVGLLHAAYATSATGMVISMCEECVDPARQVPKALVGALGLNWLCGFIFLVPLSFLLPDIATVVNDPSAQPLPVILRSAIGNEGGAFALTVPIIILGILCGTSCVTASSRCVWAFARDGAIPGWQKLGIASVNEKLGIPLNAMMASMVVQILLGLISIGSTAAFNAFNGAGVIFLTLSYVTPVAISFFNGRNKLTHAKWHLGAFGWFCNAVSIAYCAFAIPLFSMPAGLPVSSVSMNYASVVFVAGIVATTVWYLVAGRKYYNGPAGGNIDDDVFP